METRHSPDNEIAASWERCERQHNLVRDTTYPILRLRSSEVTPRFEQLVERTGGRRGIIRQLAEIAVAAGQCLVVSDADRILVRLECKNKGHSEFEDYGIALGSCWDERVAGTNGVAMAIAQMKAFTVRGKDHFYSKLQPVACTGVPLVDAENQIIGAISLSTIDRGTPAEFIFARQLLSAAASKIQRILFEQRYRDAMMISVSTSGHDAFLTSNELVAVDEAGMILGATAQAHQLIQMAESSDLLGRSFEAVFGTGTEALGRVPERVLSTRFDTGPTLRFSVLQPNVIVYPGRGWRGSPAKHKPSRVRRRLSPKLRELAIGSEAMADVLQRAQTHFELALPFTIEGESGTGKSALIAALQRTANLPQSQMATIDCALLDRHAEDQSYVETVLGRARVIDALDASDRDTDTLVFDNVDEMPAYGQARLRNLLGALEASDSTLEGGWPVSAIRVVATSRKPLKEAVKNGQFRDDLYFLLGNARFELPPLRERERPEALARALASRMAGAKVEVTAEAVDAIRRHAWPGNVRAMRSALRQSLLAGDGRRISLLDLLASSEFGDPERSPSLSGGSRRAIPRRPYDEMTLLLDALLGAHWNVSRAARNLGIGRATIHRKMLQYGIARPAKPRSP